VLKGQSEADLASLRIGMPSYYTERLAPNVSALAMISRRLAPKPTSKRRSSSSLRERRPPCSPWNWVVAMDGFLSGFPRVRDQQQLFREAMRVTRSGGLVMFSRYTPQFWEHRLEWFEIQAAHHLIGEIDYQTTGNGTIVCKDGFRATTADRPSLEKLAASLDVIPRITEVDGSSLFCEFVVP